VKLFVLCPVIKTSNKIGGSDFERAAAAARPSVFDDGLCLQTSVRILGKDPERLIGKVLWEEFPHVRRGSDPSRHD